MQKTEYTIRAWKKKKTQRGLFPEKELERLPRGGASRSDGRQRRRRRSCGGELALVLRAGRGVLQAAPSHHGQRVGLRVEHPVLGGEEVVVREQQVQIPANKNISG